MKSLVQDLRTALRHLRAAPGFASFAVTLLALGTGATAVIFSVLQSVVLQDLPYPEPSRLVGYGATNESKNLRTPALSVADFRDLQHRAESCQQLAAFRPDFATHTRTGADPVPWVTGLVTSDFFSVFGVPPLLGRTFEPSDFRMSAARTLVLSEACWRTHFGGRPDAIGSVVTVNDKPMTIIGVMPARFREPQFVDVWLPFPQESAEYFVRDSRFWTAVGRLRPGTSAEAADAEAAAIAATLGAEYPATNHGWTIDVAPLRELRVDAGTRRGLWMLAGSVALVLLVASINLANLMLSRGLRRIPEFAVRLSLGATGSRLARTVCLENMLVALAGGALGALLAMVATPVLIDRLPIQLLPRAHEIAVRPATLLATLVAALLTGVFSSLLPAAQVLRIEVAAALKSAGARAVSGQFATRMQRLMLALQVAVTLAVLTEAALLGRSLRCMEQVAPGIDPRGVVTLRISPPQSRFRSLFEIGRYYARLTEAVQRIPGVEAAAVDSSAPFSGVVLNYPLAVEGRVADADQADEAVFHSVGPDYFPTLRLRLVAGRLPGPGLTETSPAVVVINEALARRLFPDSNPIGRRIKTLPWLLDEWREIIGVVADARQTRLATPAPAALYVPQQQSPWFFTTLLIRTRGGSVSAGEITAALRAVDPTLTADLRSLDEAIARSALEARLQSTLFGIFGAAAIVLSAFGIFASTSFATGLRQREIGLRMALGSTPGCVIRWILRDAARPTLAGLAAGLPLAVILASLLRGLLFGVEPFEPATFAAVAGLIGLVTLAAALVPALQASRLSPTAALARD